jgi:hypothetical protein
LWDIVEEGFVGRSSSDAVSSSVLEDSTLEEIVGGSGDFGLVVAADNFELVFVAEVDVVAVTEYVVGIGYEGFCKERSYGTGMCSDLDRRVLRKGSSVFRVLEIASSSSCLPEVLKAFSFA